MKFELFKDKVGDYRFRLRAANGEIVAMGEGYAEKRDCEHAIKLVKSCGEAVVEDHTM